MAVVVVVVAGVLLVGEWLLGLGMERMILCPLIATYLVPRYYLSSCKFTCVVCVHFSDTEVVLFVRARLLKGAALGEQ